MNEGATPAFLFQASGLVAGAIVGSFIATLLIRWPQGRSVIAGRSACESCGARLGVRDLVPILSYTALHGRCRRCGAAIDRRHLGIELAAALVGLVALLAHPLPLALFSLLLGLWLLTLAALDAEYHWLPDLLTLPLIPAGLAVAWAGFGPPLGERLIGAAAGFIGLAAIGWLYRRLRGRTGLGGGDPKLLAALGAWVGALALPWVLLAAGALGLAAALLMHFRGEEVKATTRLPLGSLLAIAGWATWLVSAVTT
ncbi:MAG: prepilin peptidase [Sphingosinicella sp.]